MEELDSTKYTPCCTKCGWDEKIVAYNLSVHCSCACATCPTAVREREFQLAMDMRIATLRTAAAKHPEFRFGI